MKYTLSIFAFSALLVATATAQNPVPFGKELPKVETVKVADMPKDDTDRATKAMKIGGGDLLAVKVYGVPELSEEVRVNEEGDISLSLIGGVHIEGLTSVEAEKEIAKRLVDGGFLRDPHVSIFVKEYVTQGLSVMGEVTKPGIYPLLGAHRLFDAISAAGGTNKTAGRVVSITRRDNPEHPILVELSSDPVKAAAANIEVQPGDTIVVSKAGVVYVVGDVIHPSGFVMENNESLTVLQAVAMAQGLSRTAASNRAKLIRKNKDGSLTEIEVPLQKILEGKSSDVAMVGEDILFVPTSTAKGVARRSMEAVIQMATGVAVYGR